METYATKGGAKRAAIKKGLKEGDFRLEKIAWNNGWKWIIETT